MIQITIGWIGQLQCADTNIIETLIIVEQHAPICISTFAVFHLLTSLSRFTCFSTSGRPMHEQPGDRKHVVTSLIGADTKCFESPYVTMASFNVREQISYKSSLSNNMHSSAFPPIDRMTKPHCMAPQRYDAACSLRRNSTT